ncbi:PhnD/SsuA/transferrin family substrate-binding protein, partial [Patulibacter sp. S7RM1-6]
MTSFAARPSRRVLAVVVLLVLALAAGVLAARGAAADGDADAPAKDTRFEDGTCDDTAVRFGVVLPDGDAEGAAAAEVFRTDLAEQLGCRVAVVAYGTQARLVTALAMHEVDLGQLDPAAMVVADRAVGAVSVGAYAVDQDTPARAGALALWVRERTGVRDLAGLRGRRL